jgi:hypothetical protein
LPGTQATFALSDQLSAAAAVSALRELAALISDVHGRSLGEIKYSGLSLAKARTQFSAARLALSHARYG